MKLWQAKAHAAKLWPGVKLEFCRNWRTFGFNVPCVILLEGKVLGQGRGWQAAMRDAAIRWAVVMQQPAAEAEGCSAPLYVPHVVTAEEIEASRGQLGDIVHAESAGAIHAAGRDGSNDRNTVGGRLQGREPLHSDAAASGSALEPQP